MKLGYHVSIAGGLSKAVQTARQENLTALQIFPGSPRNYFPSNHTEDNLQAMRDLAIPKFVHINYFVNLAADKPMIPKSLAQNLEFCELIQAEGLVVHMGSNKNIEEGMAISIKNIQEAYERIDTE
jgi:deoxyribonuclease IV